jgi:hypothetical protein
LDQKFEQIWTSIASFLSVYLRYCLKCVGSKSHDSKKRQSLESPIQRSSQKIQKKSGTIIDSQIRKIILAIFNNPEIIEIIKNNINNMNLSMTRRVAPKGPAKPDFINYREPAPEIPDSDGEDETLDDPMEIDFVQKKDPATDVVTTKCKIKRLVIPAAIVDPGANFPIITEDIVKRLKFIIDTKEKHDLSGIATVPTESIGIVRNVPVTFAPGCTIHSDFAVVKYRKPMLILPNTLLDKYDYDLLASRRELKLVCDGEEYFIPINMHKVKNKLEINCAIVSQDDKSLVSDQISQNIDNDEDNNVPLDEWRVLA